MPFSFLRLLALAIVLAGTFHSANAEDAARISPRPAGEQTAAERQETAKGVLRLLPADAGEVVEHAGPDDAAADDHGPRSCLHS